MKQKSPLIIGNVQAAVARGEMDSNYLAAGMQGCICMPLWSSDQLEGMLSASFRKNILPDDTEVKTLEGCSTHIAAALAHARLHTEIEHERARLRAVLDQLPEGVLLIDAPLGYVQYANAAAVHIVGTPITGFADMSVKHAALMHIILDKNGQPIAPEKLSSSRALLGETSNGQEITLTRQDGSKAFLLASTAPLRKDDGTIIGAIVVFQDITARKSLEQQRNDFLTIANHELRTPITAIMGLAEILKIWVGQQENSYSQSSLRALTSIIEQSKRLTRLIEEMLDLSRIENKHLLLNIAPHNLVQTITQVIESQSITTKRHTIHFVLEGVEKQNTLIGHFDEDRIIQVLDNLISNAIKYSPEQKDIEVGLQVTGEKPAEALIWVRDHGIGIAATELPHIYERYHRASNLDRSISGLGIGLYLVNELITRHGGRVRVESIEGKGSTFYVNLPLLQPS
jgi:PAS domain S-box-containing protein